LDGQCDKLVMVVGHHFITVGVRHRVARVYQRQRRLVCSTVQHTGMRRFQRT